MRCKSIRAAPFAYALSNKKRARRSVQTNNNETIIRRTALGQRWTQQPYLRFQVHYPSNLFQCANNKNLFKALTRSKYQIRKKNKLRPHMYIEKFMWISIYRHIHQLHSDSCGNVSEQRYHVQVAALPLNMDYTTGQWNCNIPDFWNDQKISISCRFPERSDHSEIFEQCQQKTNSERTKNNSHNIRSKRATSGRK